MTMNVLVTGVGLQALIDHCEHPAIEACLRELQQARATVAQQAATISAMQAAIEMAFTCKIHPFQTDEPRNYCQCGYYEMHPIHTLAKVPKEKPTGWENIKPESAAPDTEPTDTQSRGIPFRRS